MHAAPLEPRDAQAAATLLAEAGAEGRQLVPQGAGTKLAWHSDPSTHRVLSTRGLTASLEHVAGDLVATIPAGITLAEANAALARERQWLPLDPSAGDQATIGGVVATNDSGPRRHKYGAPRDVIIGIEVALTDGRVAHAGGRVVKNVAGYDLSRLLCGSHGSLGVITSATFKLAPLPPASRTVVGRAPTLGATLELAHALAMAPITPSALELQAPTGRLLLRFETTARAADQMAAAATAILTRGGASAETVADEEERDLWRDHDRLPWGQGSAVVKVSVLPTEIGSVFAALDGAGLPAGAWSAIGRAGLGVLLLRIDGTATDQVRAIRLVRAAIEARHGTTSVLQAAPAVRQEIPSPTHAATARVMAAVKARFDPRGVLRPVPEIG